VLEVADTGLGIAADKLEQAFGISRGRPRTDPTTSCRHATTIHAARTIGTDLGRIVAASATTTSIPMPPTTVARL
jgi:hypothetical protein